MIAALVVGCSVLGVVVGWMLDPVIALVPRPVPVRGPAAPYVRPGSSPRRMVVSVLCGALFGATAARFDRSWALPAYLVLTAALLALSVIDLEHLILPDRIVYPLAAVTVVLLAVASAGDDDVDSFLRALVAGVVALAIFLALHLVAPRSMGWGDVKLSFVLGASLGWLGWGEVFLGLYLGFVYGAVVGLLLMLMKLRTRKQPVPFGPFLAAGAMTAILVGDVIISWFGGG